MEIIDMELDFLSISLRLIVALVIGGLIGVERSYHGRAAGFRTHVLVCVSTSLLMLVTVYEAHWFPGVDEGRIALDPTRMAQGIMTGIGFLGAGTIIHEGLSVRGLTTAASIWMTASIGILIGIGFHFPALVASALTLATLSLLRLAEDRMPNQYYARFLLRFPVDRIMPEAELRRLLTDHGFTVTGLNYRLDMAESYFEYGASIRSRRVEDAGRLAETLKRLDAVREFRIMPTQR